MIAVPQTWLEVLPIAPSDLAVLREEWLGSASAIVLASLVPIAPSPQPSLQ